MAEPIFHYIAVSYYGKPPTSFDPSNIFTGSKIWQKGEYFHLAGQTVTSWLELSRRHDDVTLLWGSRHCRLSSPPKIGDAKPIHVKGKPKRRNIPFLRPIINPRGQVTNWILQEREGGRSWQAFGECKMPLILSLLIFILPKPQQKT